MNKLEALIEVDEDLLKKLSMAVAAGTLSAIAAKKLYKEYKVRKILNKLKSPSQKKSGDSSRNEELTNIGLDSLDGALYLKK
jgi:hypothetical protein